ncbi:MAG: CoA transferase [Chloroflexi bacterium]|nr:CoA transferase [Chloroflexota bacterium]
MAETALEGLRVLDLTQGIAGPFCTKLLADYGADVIKIERPGHGDVARRYGPFPGDDPNPEKSGLFLHLNTNKRGITLNLKTAAGRGSFKRLAERADLVVESFMPGTMARLGLSYATLEALNQRLVLVSISNFGQTGPYRDYKATDLVIQALASPMYSKGHPDREPLKYAENTALYFAGVTAAVAALGAAFASVFDGVGQHVDISIAEAVLGSVERMTTSYLYTGEVARRAGHQVLPTYLSGAYRCQDGFVGVQGGGRGESWWPRVYRMMGMPELAEDPRFSTLQAREQNREELDAFWHSWLLDHTREEVFRAAREARFPLAPVNTTEDLLNDPHYRARGFFVGLEHPVAGHLVYPGAPFKLSETPWQVSRPAPALGQHNEEVYGGLLGLGQRDLAGLRKEGVI